LWRFPGIDHRAVVWVLDLQKYADAAEHDRYLRPLRRCRPARSERT
jgi:hypothetical protein